MNENELSLVQQKVGNIRSLLDRSKQQIALALPRHMTPERMLRVTMTAVQRMPALLECEPMSVIGAVVQASQLGLEPDGVLGHAYLVPFNNRKTGKKECQLIPGYRGLVDLSRRSGNLSTIYAHVVYERDDFDFAYGIELKLEHRPTSDPNPGAMIAAYAVARLRDGGIQFEVMWKRQIDAIRKRSKAATSGPWVTDYEQMAKKTVLRRLCKLLPVSVEMQKAVTLDEMAQLGLPQDLSSLIASTAQTIDAEAKPALEKLADDLAGDQSSARQGD